MEAAVLRIDVLGVEFDNLTLAEAVDRAQALAGGEGFHYVVTPNPEIVMTAQKDPAFQKVLSGADLVLPDGIGVIKAAAILGRPWKERVPGIDVAVALMGRMAGSGTRLFLLGAKPGVAEVAAEKLRAAYPGLQICGTHDGYFQDDAPVVEAIRAARAEVVFVCLGAPKQEFWMARNGPETGAKLMLGLGGVLDVFAGAVERAPERWQRMGLEWLYRLIREPSRIGRMARLPLFLVQAYRAKWGGKE